MTLARDPLLVTGVAAKLPGDYAKQPKAKGRQRHTPGKMNGTEERYSQLLQERYAAGEIIGWWFEPITLILATALRYTPDFMVMYPDCSIEFHEVKGFWRDDARAKIKMAAERFWMFSFVAMKPKPRRDGGGWEREDFNK